MFAAKHSLMRLLPLPTSSSLLFQRRCISLLHKQVTSSSSSSTTNQTQQDLDHAIHLVRSYDPAGYLPGRLLPTPAMQTAYFAVRGFWIETGLRFGSSARVSPNSTPTEHLEWWEQGLDQIYDEANGGDKKETPGEDSAWRSHPTLRLLHHVVSQPSTALKKVHFEDVLQGRRNDLDLKQYPTLQHLENHASLSCGSLARLVLESGRMDEGSYPVAHRCAQLVGIGHGLANALRTSIPVVSQTGKLVVPLDLCTKHGVSSPRYLLSALGQGDTEAKEALNRAVQDVCSRAQECLDEARALRDDVLREDDRRGNKRGAASVLLPALASETFLQRLAAHDYDLTNRSLRQVGTWEHARCATRMVWGYYRQRY